MKLSIIVPVYKVEPYLKRCIDSILNQTFTDFELILVDDGSPDECGSICDKYQQQDYRIKVIHKENGGLSDARNAGISIAKGEYLGFVDSDDSISKDMYQKLLAIAELHNADIACCGILLLNQSEDVVGQWPYLSENQIYMREDFINHFYPDVRRNIMPSVANKVFRRELFQKIRFPKGKIYEDAQIQLLLYDCCKLIVVCHEHLYRYYYNRPDSINNTTYTQKQFDMIEFSLNNYLFFKEKNIPLQQGYALEIYANNYMKNFFKVMFMHKNLLPLFLPYKKNFRKHIIKFLLSPRICRMKRLAIIMLFFSRRLSYKICRKYFPECILETVD